MSQTWSVAQILAWPRSSWMSPPSTTPSGWGCSTASTPPGSSTCCGSASTAWWTPSRAAKSNSCREPPSHRLLQSDWCFVSWGAAGVSGHGLPCHRCHAVRSSASCESQQFQAERHDRPGHSKACTSARLETFWSSQSAPARCLPVWLWSCACCSARKPASDVLMRGLSQWMRVHSHASIRVCSQIIKPWHRRRPIDPQHML